MTMHELAVLAGISRTNVSLILNGKADGKIAAAKSLRSRKQYVIGIVMPTREAFGAVTGASPIELMLKRLEKRDAPRRHVDIKQKLIVRNSCTE